MLRYLLPLLLLSTPAYAGMCGDMDGSGTITVTDGVNVLRAAAGLPVNVTCDGVPVPTATPAQQPTAHATPIQTSPLTFLLGTWDFRFTIISSFTDTYRLQQLTTSTSGKPVIVGLNQFGDPVLGARILDLTPGSPLPYTFELLDNEQGIVCDFHLFNRSSDNAIGGTTYVLFTDASGNCDVDTLTNGYAMNGQKVSINSQQIGAEALGLSLDGAVSGRAQALLAEAAALGEVVPANDLEPIRAELRALLRATRQH